MSQSIAHTDRIITQMMELHRLLRKHTGAFPHAKGMSPVKWPQLHALMLIRENGRMTMKEFAHALQITAPSATSFAETLVKLHWVRRSRDPKNRKLVHVSVTDRGEHILKETMQEKKRMMRKVFGLMRERDQSEFLRILQELCSAISAGQQSLS